MATPSASTVDDGPAIWFAGTLVVRKATGEDTGGSYSLVEPLAPRGFGPRHHVHHETDELFVRLEGSATVWVGEETMAAPTGTVVSLPRGIPHSFRVEADDTRRYQFAYPPGFEHVSEAVGEPAPRRDLPPPIEPDVDAMAAVAAEYGFEIRGPPPWVGV